MSPETNHCRSCGAPIIWAVTENGKRMPVDATPREDGNILLIEYPASALGDGYIEAAYVQSSLFEEWDVEAPEPRRYVSHFASCAQSKGWRKA